jgi:hypothetical protein
MGRIRPFVTGCNRPRVVALELGKLIHPLFGAFGKGGYLLGIIEPIISPMTDDRLAKIKLCVAYLPRYFILIKTLK